MRKLRETDLEKKNCSSWYILNKDFPIGLLTGMKSI